MDKRIAAVRASPLVGKNSQTSIDECWSDQRLLSEWDNPPYGPTVETPEEALSWAILQESLSWEAALNHRSGSNSDWQLVGYRAWKEKLLKH